jgi:hypothetical protein
MLVMKTPGQADFRIHLLLYLAGKMKDSGTGNLAGTTRRRPHIMQQSVRDG